MSEIAEQIALIAALLATSFVGPAVAIGFLIVRKRRARARRRSPVAIDLLRSPGHTLREQLDDMGIDVLSDVFLLMFVPLLALAIFLAQSHLRGLDGMTRIGTIYAASVLIFMAIMVRALWKKGVRIDGLKAGYDAELAVGQELDQLMRQGAFVFHDFPASNFNIDHVVIAVEGIFAVETKGFTKPNRGQGRADATVSFDGKALKFPTWATKEPLDQAERQADWLAKWLTSATGSPMHVLPVLALPGWYVELSGRGNVSVYSGRQLAQLLRSRGAQPLTDQDVQRVVHQVEQRCRTVAAKYAENKKAS
ncbi:nuclease-related domain-containing protein [Variovorax sp. KK3]|uniref:nuclease-related domain-containing protein n=1 Tax=Variovorax sp. KK3 TaxID=1855728 RepID=UPI00117E6843|nr:nuclease-related domain-containing protein [Variovorax sp. KK3]